MTRSFQLPDLGEGIHEGEILAVHVTAGQMIREGDIILEVETDKAAVEIPSPFSGKVAEVLVRPGDTVRVGDVLLTVSGEELAAAEPAPEKVAAAEPIPAKSPAKKRGPVPASPATRRLARELGVDLHQVTPAAPSGVVTAEEVRAFAEKQHAPEATPPRPAAGEKQPAPAPPVGEQAADLPDFARWGPVERVPFRSVRRATARQMVTAWSRIPHVSSQDTLDVTLLESFRRKHKAAIEEEGGRLTMTIFALKAVATALKTFPQFNASLDEQNQEVILKKYFHVGVAVNAPHGLIVPVVRDVDRKSIKELAVEVHAIVRQTHERTIPLEALQGGTFTITNAGAMGGGFFTPIINYPQVAILGMGQARMQPAVVNSESGISQIVPRLMMPLVLSIDHRVLDGADAIAFLRTVCEVLRDPDELLMSMV